MPREDAFWVEGIVLEVLSDSACRVALSNGHSLIAHATRAVRKKLGTPGIGQQLSLQISPYDLSKGRIVGVGINRKVEK